MLNKDGGVQADVTVSVLEKENSHDSLSPSSDGKLKKVETSLVMFTIIVLFVLQFMIMLSGTKLERQSCRGQGYHIFLFCSANLF